MDTKLSSIEVCQSNVAMGQSLVKTLSSNTDLVIGHMQRIRNLCEEAADDTYSTGSINAIEKEIISRYNEVFRIFSSTEYNGSKLITDINFLDCDSFIRLQVAALELSAIDSKNFNFQIGIDASNESKISFNSSFNRVGFLLALTANNFLNLQAGYHKEHIETVDKVLSYLTDVQTYCGTMQNRLESAAETLDVQYSNLTSSLSIIKDADIAQVSSEYIRQQILQNACASLLATANQSSSIALGLI